MSTSGKRPNFVCGVAALALSFSISGCKSGGADTAEVAAPPDAARAPQLKSEAELAAERQERINRGEITPADSPMLEAEQKRLAAMRAASSQPKLAASPSAIQGDILLVNKSAVTVDEVLYTLRDEVEKTRTSKSKLGQREAIEKLLRTQVQQEVGSLLVYEKAMSALEDPQKQALDGAVDKEVNNRIAREFESSTAKFQRHLARYGLTLPQFKERVKRQMVVRGYTREMLMPRVVVRRDELMEYYKNNSDKYATPASREMLVIEAPFDQFLPEETTWNTATREEQARARLKARRHINEAHAALSGKPFADVAREFSKGPHAQQGGSWGEIGAQLKPPFDRLSGPVFSFQSGQFSEPIEMEGGWYIAGCGNVQNAHTPSFAEIQYKIREDLREERFNKTANDYVSGLAAKSTVAAVDSFLRTALQRATSQNWPKPE